MNWGMICYQVPLTTYPDTYNRQPLMYAALASQKNHMAIYPSCIYSDSRERKWFKQAHQETGKRMDVGKSCMRFKKLEDLPLELIGRAFARVNLEGFLSPHYEQAKRR